MKVLTVVTFIFLPLTLLAGIYGRNFENLPGLSWRAVGKHTRLERHIRLS
jgi:Mg2+ and Co2+ transporter CorA